MTLDLGHALEAAWMLFRRDRALLLRIAAPFLFWPALALQLLVADPPSLPERGSDDATNQAWLQSFSDWAAGPGLWYLAAYAVGYAAVLALLGLYLVPARPAAGQALRTALLLLPRYLLALLLVSIPSGIGLLLLIVPGLYVLGRFMLVGAVIVAEQPVSAVRALQRSLALTRGHGAVTMALAAAPLLGGWLAGKPFLALDAWMRGHGAGNPVTLAAVDSAAAAIAMLADVAAVLLAVVVYRRLAAASSGI